MTLKEFITSHEGKRLKPYKCPAGKNTIGVGYNFDSNHLPSDIETYLKTNGQITEEMSDRLLNISISRAAHDCLSLFPSFNDFSENRKMALIDWMFNLGLTKASRFIRTVHCINTGHWDGAANNMRQSLWARQVGRRAVEVTYLIENG